MSSCIGELTITDKQAARLQVKPYAQISPQLEKCCLLLSANESYARAEQDVEVLTGITVHSTQQRLVHRQEWTQPSVSLPPCKAEMLPLNVGLSNALSLGGTNIVA